MINLNKTLHDNVIQFLKHTDTFLINFGNYLK